MLNGLLASRLLSSITRVTNTALGWFLPRTNAIPLMRHRPFVVQRTVASAAASYGLRGWARSGSAGWPG